MVRSHYYHTETHDFHTKYKEILDTEIAVWHFKPKLILVKWLCFAAHCWVTYDSLFNLLAFYA